MPNNIMEIIEKNFSKNSTKHFNSILFINEENLSFNTKKIAKICRNTEIAPVVKSNGYGIGANLLIKYYLKENIKSFFVGNLNEAIKIRNNFKNINIYILNCKIKSNLRLLIKYDLIPVINDIEELTNYSKIKSTKVPCIIHVDTGMNRLGIEYQQIFDASNNINFKNIEILFLMSHLACSEDQNNKMNLHQLQALKKVQKNLNQLYGKFIKTSIANSSGILLGKKFFLDLVRPGQAFLGTNPTNNKKKPFKTVIYFFAHIVQIKNANKNSSVGYGATYKIKKKTKIATISLGYANGFPRSFSNLGSVFIKNKKVKVIGKISMDLTVIDITDTDEFNIKVGDPVEIFGINRSLEEFAEQNNTIPHEIICSIGKNSKIIIAK